MQETQDDIPNLLSVFSIVKLVESNKSDVRLVLTTGGNIDVHPLYSVLGRVGTQFWPIPTGRV